MYMLSYIFFVFFVFCFFAFFKPSPDIWSSRRWGFPDYVPRCFQQHRPVETGLVSIDLWRYGAPNVPVRWSFTCVREGQARASKTWWNALNYDDGDNDGFAGAVVIFLKPYTSSTVYRTKANDMVIITYMNRLSSGSRKRVFFSHSSTSSSVSRLPVVYTRARGCTDQ